jgi:hypothetical protein
MTTGAARSRPDYAQDFYRWTRDQARRLRAQARLRGNEPIDWLPLAEEIEDLGRSERRTCESLVEQIMAHLLKLEHARDRRAAGHWKAEVTAFRATLEKALTPSIRGLVKRELEARYRIGARIAIRALEDEDPGLAARVPATCPYGWRQISEDWLP